jgi:hypothetical protein
MQPLHCFRDDEIDNAGSEILGSMQGESDYLLFYRLKSIGERIKNIMTVFCCHKKLTWSKSRKASTHFN